MLVPWYETLVLFCVFYFLLSRLWKPRKPSQ